MTSFKKNIKYDEAFEIIEQEMKNDVPINWDTFASKFLNLKVVPVEANKKERRYYVDQRYVFITSINNRAEKYNKNWRIRIIDNNNQIMKVKKHNSEMATLHHIKKIAACCNNAIKEAQLMIDNNNIENSQKELFQHLLNTLYGTKINAHGSIIANRKINKEIKEKILSIKEWDDVYVCHKNK